ncbi:hypothetical protein QN379_23105 [Glaciimonas sp. Gout2]|nr:hypothetical protein [Glaciimonas sp. Gout2]MEB0084899.1 hypothetical protein [Glaciimonas sp. Gout2]
MTKLRLLRTADQEFVISLLVKKLVMPHEEEEADWLLLLCRIVRNQSPMSELLTQTFGPLCILQSSRERSILLNAVRSAYKQLPDALFENDRGLSDAVAAFDHTIDLTYTAELLEQRQVRPQL